MLTSFALPTPVWQPPARHPPDEATGDEDARLSVSGLQQFHGEDLGYANRVKAQQEELRMWCAEMSASKAAAANTEKLNDAEYAKRAIEIDQAKIDLEATDRIAKVQSNVAVAEYQLAQTAAKREREAAAAKAELQDNIEEIQNNLAGDLLTENPAVGRSFIAPNRVRPDHYKGMAPMEQAAFFAAQEQQRTQALEAAALSKAESLAADAAMEATRRAGAYQDAQVAMMRAEMRKALMDENTVIAKQQYASKAFLTSQV